MRDTLKPVGELKVAGMIQREEIEVGDIISYPEGYTSLVIRVEGGAFFTHLEPMNPIIMSGSSITFYGNISDFKAQTRDDYNALLKFRVDKLSNNI